MSIGGPEDLAALQRVGKIVASAREAMLKAVRPGVSTAELDEVARDVVNVDVSAQLDGYWADTGASIGVGEISAKLQRLLAITRAAQHDAMHKARAGARLSEIGRTVERHARGTGFRVVRNIGGHGVGRFRS
jgi:methionyl aminopeptidase